MWSFDEYYKETAKLVNPEQGKKDDEGQGEKDDFSRKKNTKQQRKKAGAKKKLRRGHWNGGAIKWWRGVGSRLNRQL